MGVVVLAFTFWKAGRFRTHSKFIRNLCDAYLCDGIDLSGDTLYTDCISHRWTLDNIVRKKHGRLGSRFQDSLFHSTLTTTIWFSLFFGIGILILGVILVRSIMIAGMILFIFLIGGFTILGSGGAKASEDLLSMLQTQDIEDLSRQDYAYAAVAQDSIKKELVLSFIVGSILVVLSPWGELVPVLLAWLIASFTTYMIWNPTMLLSEFSVPLALLYLTTVWPVFAIVIIYAIRKVRGSEEETNERAAQL